VNRAYMPLNANLSGCFFPKLCLGETSSKTLGGWLGLFLGQVFGRVKEGCFGVGLGDGSVCCGSFLQLTNRTSIHHQYYYWIYNNIDINASFPLNGPSSSQITCSQDFNSMLPIAKSRPHARDEYPPPLLPRLGQQGQRRPQAPQAGLKPVSRLIRHQPRVGPATGSQDLIPTQDVYDPMRES
jgi:hypothetical protein